MPYAIVPFVLLSFALVMPAACNGAAEQSPVATATAASSAATPDAAGPQGPAPDAGARPAGAQTLSGTIAETMNSGGYTYARLKTGDGDVWIAADEFAAKNGEQLSAAVDMAMENFHSKTLNRDFPRIYFVSQVARNGEPLAPAPKAASSGMPSMAPSHGGGASAQPAPSADVKPNAPPPGGHAIGDVFAKRAALAGKAVTVRGTVVKVNNGIMGRNWFHLRDGSGSEKDGTQDLTVTSDATVKVGDVVTVTGTLAVKKDFGAGYAYEAILEGASVTGK